MDTLNTGSPPLDVLDWAVLELPDNGEAIWEMATVTTALGPPKVAAAALAAAPEGYQDH